MKLEEYEMKVKQFFKPMVDKILSMMTEGDENNG